MKLPLKSLTIFLFTSFLIQAFLPTSARATNADMGGSPQNAILTLEENANSDPVSQDPLSPSDVPQITLFYGPSQSFGQVGQPQRQINVLGNVSDPDGIGSIYYSLNGKPQQPLSIGPDTRRLLEAGDFNIELFDEELAQGNNTLVITATDTLNETTSTTVAVNYDRTHPWPLPYQTNWASGIQSQSQVVDGDWEVQGGGLRTVQIGYDRLVAIGDIGWKDYEVTVPITIHSIDPAGYAPPSYGPGIGLIMRWTGNTDDPVPGMQPKEGWWPLGAIGWFRWQQSWPTPRLQIYGNQGAILAEDSGKIPIIGETYIFKMRVETTANGPQYQLKVWLQSVIEPVDWDLSGIGNPNDPANGSLVLMAHHVDATFGNVQVVRVGSEPSPSTIISDDFNSCNLNDDLWNFVNPVDGGDATLTIDSPFTDNAWLTISIPAGSDHDLLPNDNRAPRVMQPANDTDFEVEAKFESGVDSRFQMQGILVEESPSKFLRFEYHSDGIGTKAYIASYEGAVRTVLYQADLGVSGIAPLYMHVKRADHRWIQSYSTDGINWHPLRSFHAALSVNSIGVYAANAVGNASPQFTGLIDYFFNVGSPIIPEDGDHQEPSLTVLINGNGDVTVNPDQTSYTCNQEVSLEATPAVGWTFSQWSGDLSGTSNPATIIMDASKVVTATFSAIDYNVIVETIGQGVVNVTPEQPAYHYGDVITLTATASPGWAFTNWGGALSGTTNPITTTVTGNLLTNATFVEQVYDLTMTINGQGSVTVDIDGPYHYGDEITLTATPQAGWFFTSWSGAVIDSGNPITVTVETDLNITANFLPLPQVYYLYMPVVVRQNE